MKATDILEAEHKEILKIIGLMDEACDKLEEGKNVPYEVFEKASFFIRDYSDRIHHMKEEDLLFGIIQNARLPKEVAISVMLTEHDQARYYLRKLFKANSRYRDGNQDTRKEIITYARKYAQLLRQHIIKEDEELFPLANKIISEEKKQELSTKFIEQDKGQKPQRYLKLIDEIKELVDQL